MPPKTSKAVAAKTKGSVSIAQIKKLQEAMKKQAEEKRKSELENKKRLEQLKKKEEEERQKQELAAKKAEEEKQKRKEYAKEKKERDKKRKVEDVQKALLVGGNVIIPALAGEAINEAPIKPSALYAPKRKKKQQKDNKENEEKQQNEIVEGEEHPKEEEEDNWEKLIGDEEVKEEQQIEEEGEEDNWEKVAERLEEETAAGIVESGKEKDDEKEEEDNVESISSSSGLLKPLSSFFSFLDADVNELIESPESINTRHEIRMAESLINLFLEQGKTDPRFANGVDFFKSLLPRQDVAKEAFGNSVSFKNASPTALAAVTRPETDIPINPSSIPLRSPVCCILGHVDVGKTKILDKLRKTNVQEGEAGGITQQIGATFFPVENIRTLTTRANFPSSGFDRLPGLLIIDTPGHESFTNLRSRGCSMCNVAILVVDIMHSLEKQTIESLNLIRGALKGLLNEDGQNLKEVEGSTGGGALVTPFVVALNKIDRIFGWKPYENHGFYDSYARQGKDTQDQFDNRLRVCINDFKKEGLTVALYKDAGDDMTSCIPIIPTSAHTGEGLADLLGYIMTLSQRNYSTQLQLLPKMEATVLEVKTIEGKGTTIDIMLTNGGLTVGNKIILMGSDGPIVSTIRALLTPRPLKEIRVKAEYIQHHVLPASIGVKISADNLNKAMAGSALHVVYHDEEIPVLANRMKNEIDTILASFHKDSVGTYVIASTVGSLEALITFLNTQLPPIPVFGVSVGPVRKKDITAASVMVEKDPKFAVILAFDVPMDDEVQKFAEEKKVRIMTANVIYHLTQQFTEYLENHKKMLADQAYKETIFPVKLSVLCSFNNHDPLVIGVKVECGILKAGTPLSNLTTIEKKKEEKEKTTEVAEDDIGVVVSLEVNKVAQEKAIKGQECAIKIVAKNSFAKTFGRHLDVNHVLVSRINRQSIDNIKEHFRDILNDNANIKLIKELKGLFDIV